MVNVLYISYDGMTDPLGQSQVIPYLRAIAQEYKIALISFEKSSNNSAVDSMQQNLNQLDIDWFPLSYTKSPPVLSTVWDVIRLNGLVKRLHKQYDFQLVHCRSYIAALAGLRMKRNLEVPFIFDMRGFWADERVEGNLWNIRNPLYRKVYKFFKIKEFDYIWEADRVVSLTAIGKQEIESWSGLGPIDEKIEVVPCCTDLQLFKDSTRNNQYAMERIASDGCRVGYLGAIGTWYLLEEMLTFFKVLSNHYPQSTFEFITKESSKLIFDSADRIGINRSQISVRSATREQVPELTKNWDLSLCFIKPSYSKKASSPTKLGELMAMGIPVICNAGVGDTDYLIEKYKTGAYVSAFTTIDFETVIKNLSNIVTIDAKSIRKAAEDYFSLEEGQMKYLKIYNQTVRYDNSFCNQ